MLVIEKFKLGSAAWWCKCIRSLANQLYFLCVSVLNVGTVSFIYTECENHHVRTQRGHPRRTGSVPSTVNEGKYTSTYLYVPSLGERCRVLSSYVYSSVERVC
jgi:hypothetical protein